MSAKLYKYGNDKLPMKILKNVYEVIDFVNPRNENLKQSTIRQRIVSALRKGILFPGEKPDLNGWKRIGSVKRVKRSVIRKVKRVTVAQRIKRQPHLKKIVYRKGTLKPKSILAKYYRYKKQNKFPAPEESPAESMFKNVSVIRKKGRHITRFYQEIPKTIIFEDYWKIYKEEILRKVKEYPVSKVKCVMRIHMQRVTPTVTGPIEAHPFESEIFMITHGMDVDESLIHFINRYKERLRTFLRTDLVGRLLI